MVAVPCCDAWECCVLVCWRETAFIYSSTAILLCLGVVQLTCSSVQYARANIQHAYCEDARPPCNTLVHESSTLSSISGYCLLATSVGNAQH